MTEDTPVRPDDRHAELMFARAIKAFEITVAALEAAVDTFKADYDSGYKDVLDEMKAVNGAFKLAIATERDAREQAERHIGGAIRAGELDLDAAREEIGLRLACLRSADAD